MTTLSEILSSVPFPYTLTGDSSIEIIAPFVETEADVLPGGVFVARPGSTVDGHTFIPVAIARGAAAIVGEDDITDLTVPYIRVENALQAVGYFAAAYHGFPSRQLVVIGVTGTDGKTTTSTILHTILQAATGDKAGLISTVSAVIGDETLDTGLHVTTPGAPLIQSLLARMVVAGLTHVVLEMTSHGLAQGRLNGVDIDVAVITNVTHEHLDYHRTFDAYREAKGRIFAMLSTSARKAGTLKISVLNADDASIDYFMAYPTDRVFTYALNNGAQIRAANITYNPDGTSFRILGDGMDALVRQSLVGRYNVYNAVAAVTAAHALGISIDAIANGLASVAQIPGRMERIDAGQGYLALVDFAHTPNALATVLTAARTLTGDGGRVIAIFGSAGLRDREKRRLMPEAGIKLADFSIMTAEDPRTEPLEDILATMAEAAVAAGGVEGETFIRVPDRGEALLRACQMARPGDVVISCGKGHEQSMAFGTVEYPWDDRAALRAAIGDEPLRTLPTATASML